MNKLSKTEKRLFDYLKEREPRVVGYLELYTSIIGEYYQADEAAINHVRVIVCAIRKKLGKDMIVTVNGRGVYIKDGLEMCPCCEQIL